MKFVLAIVFGCTFVLPAYAKDKEEPPKKDEKAEKAKDKAKDDKKEKKK